MSLNAILAVRVSSQLSVQPDYPKKQTLDEVIENGPIHIPIRFIHSHMEDVIIPELPGGYFPTREEFESFAFRCRAFYDTVGDEWIDGANQKVSDSNSSYKRPPPDLSGSIYLAYAETGQYKIGVSREPKKRIRIFDTKMPVKVDLIHSFPCDNAYEAEKVLHGRYSHKHHDGEWFNLEWGDIEYIKSIVRFYNGEFEVI